MNTPPPQKRSANSQHAEASYQTLIRPSGSVPGIDLGLTGLDLRVLPLSLLRNHPYSHPPRLAGCWGGAVRRYKKTNGDDSDFPQVAT